MADRFRTPRRRKLWWSIPNSAQNITTPATGISGSITFSEARTVLRCMGEYIINPASAPTINDHCVIGIGLAIVSADAVTVGGTAVPDPVDEPEYPWLFLATHPLIYESTTVEVQLGAGVVRGTYDVKSMRKVKPREALALIFQYVDGSGVPPIDITFGVTRVLQALP